MGAGVEWGGFKIKCGSGLVCQTIQIGTVGNEVCEEFPSQECSLTLIIRDWESLEVSVKRCHGIKTVFVVWFCFHNIDGL